MLTLIISLKIAFNGMFVVVECIIICSNFNRYYFRFSTCKQASDMLDGYNCFGSTGRRMCYTRIINRKRRRIVKSYNFPYTFSINAYTGAVCTVG